nr:ATP-binding cassette domain-containing protein [Treponema sp.]
NISKNYPKGYVKDTDKTSVIASDDKGIAGGASVLASDGKDTAGGASVIASEAKQSYPPVIKDFSYKFTKGQKIGIFGDNGSGKSTFLNIVTGNLQPDSGSIDVGLNTKFGYYTQNPVFKDTSLTVLEYIKETAEHMKLNAGGNEVSATKFLEEFGFEGKIQHSPVSTLSGGERKRLYLVRLLLENPNFLILDEPTNDFDIFTMNILEQFLMGYEGCLLLVSHDRYFMDKTVDSLFILEDDGNISGFVGKCSEYIELREEMKKEAAREEKEAAASKKSDAGKSDTSASNSSGGQANSSPAASSSAKKQRLSFKEQKEFEALDAEIPALEAEQKELEAQMASSDFVQVQKAGERYKEIEKLLEEKYPRWEELAERA